MAMSEPSFRTALRAELLATAVMLAAALAVTVVAIYAPTRWESLLSRLKGACYAAQPQSHCLERAKPETSDFIALQSLFSGERDNDGEAVAHQVRYAIQPIGDTSNWDDSTWRNLFLNKAAAYNAGFIDHHLLAPDRAKRSL